ncbi:MFS transporter [Sphingomonadaceae bacterium G21617-S1]|jgi:MFS family permease|uniref:MFS transporter n=1 Tax=Rhizorhabdus sp. TaxID=1968843 RepID=UPI00198ECB63|nr:MFS transporter [Rhizorhabdus sp.]MBD3761946.1 MFS transporter [Rhizorhabdus sp.]MCZ4340731.1 MFS transporter [Sphingomonadaceae bacterium G21617-S1]
MALILNDPGGVTNDDSELVGTAMSRWGTVLALLLVYIVSYIDRQVLTIVVDPIKTSLNIGDTEIGLLQGVLFGIVLTVAAVPMSYLIDKFNRVRVLVSCIILWSLATLSCAFVTTFTELVIGRIGLAIAEAVVPMAAMSVIGDLFPRHKVGRAAAVFMNGTYFGNGAAMMLSGWMIAWLTPMQGQPFPIIGTFEVWRGLFIGMACLSIVVAFIILLFLKEPARRELTKETVDSELFWAFFWKRRRFILSYCLFAFCIATVGYSLYAWPATLLIRVHGMPAANVGIIVGPMFIITSIPGTALAAWFGSRCTPERALQQLMLMMLCFIIILCPLVLMLSLGSKPVAIVALGGVLLMYAATHAAILTPMQLIAPNRMRGRLAAVSSLIFATPASMGPVAVGYLTDHVFQDPMALGKAMAIVLGGVGVAGIFAGLLARREATLLERETELQGAGAPAQAPHPA